MIEFYEFTDEEGLDARCEVDLSLYEDAPQADKPYVLWLFVKNRDPLDPQFIDFRTDLIETLKLELGAVYTGTISRDGWCELYFYAASPKVFENLVSGTMGRHCSYAHEMASSRDSKWELYLERLYPDPYVALTIQNRQTIDALLEAGDDLLLEREVEHYFYFQTKSTLERFLQSLSSHGFALKEYIEDNDSDYTYGAIVIKTQSITREQVKETTLMLYDAVLQEHGNYEGWSTILG
jgi:regulator of RNase E activity RraB